jgi:hypothetical protein
MDVGVDRVWLIAPALLMLFHGYLLSSLMKTFFEFDVDVQRGMI